MRTRTLVILATLFLTSTASPAFSQTPPPPPPAPAPPRAARPVEPPSPPPAPPAVLAAPAQAPRPTAQAPRPTPPPGAPTAPLPARSNEPDLNVRIDLKITDTYGGSSTPKTVMMVLAYGGQGRIRTHNPGLRPVLNVDALARSRAGGKTWLSLTFEYIAASSATNPAERPGEINESVVVMLDDGKPLVVTQSADPASDRKVTVEVTATVIK